VSGVLGAIVFAAGVGLLWFGTLTDLPARLERRGFRMAVAGRARLAARLAVPTATLALVCGLASWWLLGLPVMALLAGAAGAYVPFGLRRVRGERDRRERERAWPAALEQLADGLEAGLAFPAAAAFVGESGPSVLRPQFGRFYTHVRDGALVAGLDELAEAPERAAGTAAALLRAAFVEVPTGRVAPMIRELAQVLRERWEIRERARGRALSLRREATVLALSPIAFLLLIGWSSPGYLDAYRSAGGTIVSVVGAAVIGGCYLAMLRLGRVSELGKRDAA
jgi:tight adherence protein B